MKYAEIEMESGEVIKAVLYPEKAPITVENFEKLANSGFYDGLIFHRVRPNFLIQGGCPRGKGNGDPGYHIKGEFMSNGWNNDLEHDRGILSMARMRDPDTAGSQFFITVSKNPHLDGQYAAFGRVLDGMDVVDRISREKRNFFDKPKTPQVMKRVIVYDE